MASTYSCPKCKIVFKYPSLLKTHFRNVYHCLLIEDEIEKFFNTYDCLLCKKKFKNSKSLNRHCKETICGKKQNLQISSQSQNNNTTNDNDTLNYIYLIEKFDVNNKEYIYKFDRTNQEGSESLIETIDETKLLLMIHVNDSDSDIVEQNILNILNTSENIKQCSFDNKHFICNDKKIIKNIIIKNIIL
jgi:hypothetical protein